MSCTHEFYFSDNTILPINLETWIVNSVEEIDACLDDDEKKVILTGYPTWVWSATSKRRLSILRDDKPGELGFIPFSEKGRPVTIGDQKGFLFFEKFM